MSSPLNHNINYSDPFDTTRGCWRYLEKAFPEPPLIGTRPAEKAIIDDHLYHFEIDGFLFILRIASRGGTSWDKVR